MSAIPVGWHLCDGSDGTPDLRGRFLEGSETVGSYIAAGLPNITGSVNGREDGLQDFTSWTDHIGAFIPGIRNSAIETSNEHRICTGYHTLYFDASYSNSIYGASETVQPPAYTVYYIIKIS